MKMHSCVCLCEYVCVCRRRTYLCSVMKSGIWRRRHSSPQQAEIVAPAEGREREPKGGGGRVAVAVCQQQLLLWPLLPLLLLLLNIMKNIFMSYKWKKRTESGGSSNPNCHSSCSSSPCLCSCKCSICNANRSRYCCCCSCCCCTLILIANKDNEASSCSPCLSLSLSCYLSHSLPLTLSLCVLLSFPHSRLSKLIAFTWIATRWVRCPPWPWWRARKRHRAHPTEARCHRRQMKSKWKHFLFLWKLNMLYDIIYYITPYWQTQMQSKSVWKR